MIRVGLVDIETSHRERFTEVLHAGDQARVVAVCPGEVCPEAEAQDFVTRFGIGHVVCNPADMAGEVDVAFILGTDWDRHLERAMPFIKRGMPVFIDKPIAGNLRDCLELERLARDEGARIIGGSSMRYAEPLAALRKELDDQQAQVNFAVIHGENGFFDYGIHAVEMAGGLLGGGARSVAWLGGDRPAVHHVSYRNGAQAIIDLAGPSGAGFRVDAATTTGWRQVAITGVTPYRTLMEEVIRYMHGQPHRLAPIEALTESIRIMLAAKVSRERGGAVVRLSELAPDAAGFDGTAFARQYAAQKRAVLSKSS